MKGDIGPAGPTGMKGDKGSQVHEETYNKKLANVSLSLSISISLFSSLLAFFSIMVLS